MSKHLRHQPSTAGFVSWAVGVAFGPPLRRPLATGARPSPSPSTPLPVCSPRASPATDLVTRPPAAARLPGAGITSSGIPGLLPAPDLTTAVSLRLRRDYFGATALLPAGPGAAAILDPKGEPPQLPWLQGSC
jgi:hypothetical protein